MTISPVRLVPVSRKDISPYHLPTIARLANNYTGVRDRTQVNSTTDARVDHIFDAQNRLFVRYSYNTGDTFTPPVFPIVNGIEGGGGGSFPGKNDTAAHNFGASYSKVFSPSLVGEFRTGYLNVNIASYGLNYGSNVAASFGLPGVNIDDLTSGRTPITLTGYAGAGDATFLPPIQVNHTCQGSGPRTNIKGPP